MTTQNKPVFRASFSVLNLWASGNWEDAVKAYFKLDRFVTRAMAEGQEYHAEYEKHIKETKTLPEVFGYRVLINPKPEEKLVVKLYDWLEVVCVIDCLDAPTIYEFKTGISSSQTYANTMQCPLYAFIATMAGIYVDRAEIHHYDQHAKEADMSIVWITDAVLKQAQEWLETYASEMHHYLLENDLYNQLKKPEAIEGIK